MKNTFGNNITVTLFGESHGTAIGCVIDGLTPGIKVDMERINRYMTQRASRSDISTPRREPDEVEFISGVKGGYTEGTPICILIKNTNTISSSYSNLENTPRPSHADLTAEYKYHGYQDKSGGGHFSGRITAPIVAAGALIRCALSERGIKVGTHIKELHGITDRDFENYTNDIEFLDKTVFPCLDKDSEKKMKDEILKAKELCDSVGGILETAVIGIPEGIGEPWFDTAEGMIAHAIFSIPGIKGIEFGEGFKLSQKYGSEASDFYRYENGSITAPKNVSGGILGGITNGMPIIFRSAVKPTPSISKNQKTVNLKEMKNTEISVEGRHDPAIIHRARAVVDAVTAIVIADLLVTRFGTDYLIGE